MNISHRFPTAMALTAALALAGLCTAPVVHAAGSLRAAYVEEVIPSRTYTGVASLSDLSSRQGMGPGTGIWGITSITITNQEGGVAQVNLLGGRNSGSDCSIFAVGGGYSVLPTLFVQPFSTLHLTFPTPLVVAPINGYTCIAAGLLTGARFSVQVQVHGVVN